MRQKKIPPTTALHITLLAGLFAALLSGCHLTQKSAPSVIVLAVDNLGVNQINCNQDTHATGMDSNSRSPRSGFAQMCQESVRFTHAFTTSPLAGPATASLLTGQYPLQHGLRDNRNFLSSRILSVAEVAQKKGVATSFFSGGAPILRKLNLQQGFETFDDNFVPTSTLLFRPFRRTEKIFENWLKEIGRQPFLSIFYLPDLNFSFSPTVNSLGQVRELNFESQLEEIDESLFSLIETLKKNKAWDSTMIILVGLNGPQSSNEGELAATDLFSERTQVSLLIKPAQKPRDQGMNWGFDQNVNLADVGATLMEIYGGEALSSLTSLPVFGLQDILKNPSGNSVGEPKWDRPLLIESGWAEISQIRSAFRWGQFLYLLDDPPVAYNSLIDKLENSPLRSSDPSLRLQWDKVFQIAKQNKISQSLKMPRETFLKWKGLSDYWMQEILLTLKKEDHQFALERLAHRLKNDREITQSYSLQLLDQQNWTELQGWAQGMLMGDLEKLATLNLETKILNPKLSFKFDERCLQAAYLGMLSISDTRTCGDSLTLSLFDWVRAEKSGSDNSKELSRKKFIRQYAQARFDQRILENFWISQGIWDLSSDLRTKMPTVELVFALPEYQKYRLSSLKLLAQQKEEPSEKNEAKADLNSDAKTDPKSEPKN